VNIATNTLAATMLCLTVSLAVAQQPDAPAPVPAPADAPAAAPAGAKPGKATAQSEAGEPRANTSEPPASTSQPRATTAEPRVNTPRPAAAPARTTGSAQKTPAGTDRLDLGTATVTGDREQPKVMYIVPWKKSDIGDLAGKPMNSLVDEILAPVDRDVFKREVVYYKAVQADASQNGAQSHPSEQGEK
jgi:hypothetical protein